MRFGERWGARWAELGLRCRILTAFALLMTLTALLYVWALLQAVRFTEETLMTQEMRTEEVRVSERLSRGLSPDVGAGWRAYAVGPAGESLPQTEALLEVCRGAPEGFSEAVRPDALFLYKRRTADRTVCLTLNQEEFEASEVWIMRFAALSVVVVLLLSVLVGALLAQAVLAPVRRLSDAVRRQVGAAVYEPVAAAVSTDEVGELARLCDRALRELYDALEREKAFTGDVSHELRTPLTVIATSAELLQLSVTDDRDRKLVGRILRSAQIMTETTELLLDLVRSGSNRPETNRAATADEVLEEVLSGCSRSAHDKGLRIRRVDVRPSAAAGRRFPARHLATVLGNLIGNAVRYTSEGVVLVVLDEEGVTVADTGPGLAPDEVGHVFRAGWRGRGANDAEGLGLGLAIARKVAQRCGWTLGAEDPGEWYGTHAALAARLEGRTVGAVFRLRLAAGVRRRADQAPGEEPSGRLTEGSGQIADAAS